ncbi:metal ABC transporter ATP-binding protein [Dongia deserti]|uniref:metal ABC transporter ATP-binding protein n=1 Tax=Dongia deserti TaxID=2268030 RepID=UPI000E64D398|nr:metal ABC transporter ATP-binding protein [Dongia deserti]
MGKLLLLSLTAMFAVGCATSPRDIEAVHVSPEKYQSYNCEQIAAELDSAYLRGAQMREAIDADAAGDAAAVAVGAVLFWPVMFFAIGDADEAEEYGKLKGEYEALQAAGTARQCDIAYKPLQEPAKTASTSAPGAGGRK